MERHVLIFLNKISFGSITIATFTLVLLFLQTPETCISPELSSKSHLRFPQSSCDTAGREYIPLEKKNKRIWSTNFFQKQVQSYAEFFQSLRDLGLLHNHSKVLCVSAGAGQEVMALTNIGIADVTGVELVDSPPLVSRADPHNLPFFDDIFDLAFSAHLAKALFPVRFVSEMERTVRTGGTIVVVVEECGDEEVREIVSLFRKSKFLSAKNVTLTGQKTTRIIMRVRAS